MIFRFISQFFTVLVAIFLVVVLAYAGIFVYANWIQKEPGEYSRPSARRAEYELVIQSTGKVLYTDDYELDGHVYILDGFWERVDDTFVFRDRQTALDQSIFGTITIRSR